jgi:flagellar hook assembly protein FlgD
MVCFPNPFNPTTTIRYHLQADADVELRVFSVSGRLVRTLVGSREHAGWHTVTWDARDDRGHEVASGVYVCELKANDVATRRRLTLLK